MKQLIINFPETTDCPLSTIEELVESGLQQGWSTSDNEDTEGFLYNGPLNNYTLQRHPREAVLQDLAKHQRGSIAFWFDDIDFSLGLHATWNQSTDLGGFQLRFDPVHYRRHDASTVTMAIVRIMTGVYEVLKPSIACSGHPIDNIDTIEQFSDGEISDVYWITLLAPRLIENMKQNKIETDRFWFSNSLPDGGLILVATADPFDFTPSLKEELRAECIRSE